MSPCPRGQAGMLQPLPPHLQHRAPCTLVDGLVGGVGTGESGGQLGGVEARGRGQLGQVQLGGREGEEGDSWGRCSWWGGGERTRTAGAGAAVGEGGRGWGQLGQVQL